MLLDTSAWIEFFIKSERGKKVKQILEKEKCHTSIISISELLKWSLKENLNPHVIVNIVKKLTEIININEEIAILAGELTYQRKKIVKNWGMIDSIILATSSIYDLKILTKDTQFKDLENVELL